MNITSVDIVILGIFITLMFAIYKMLKTNKNILSVKVIKLDSVLPANKINVLNDKKNENISKEDMKSFLSEIEKLENYNLIFKELKKYDKTFSSLQLFNEICDFFTVIFNSFYNRDIKKISSQLSDEVANKFKTEINELNKNKQVIVTDLIRIKHVDIKDIKMNKKKLTVMVEFITEQTAILKDENGKIIKGDDNKIENITDLWCITKNYSSKTPVWQLEKTIGE